MQAKKKGGRGRTVIQLFDLQTKFHLLQGLVFQKMDS